MAAAIYAHGVPPTMGALDALLMQEWKKEVWRSYQAEGTRAMLAFFGAKDVRRYEDIIAPPEPELTKVQIAERRKRLLEGLRGD